ncbi:MAG: hypothetical protein HY747_07620 [Elusimicrobia bacterium]|nr:hypothetical protein [Elusimicrobiota bacterium]
MTARASAFIALSVFFFTLSFSSTLSASELDLSGEIAVNYRGIGGKPTEVEVENQLYVSDIYFAFTKQIQDRLPFFLEFTTNLDGEPVLNQFHLTYGRIERVKFTFGKFVVPFGRFNELYKPGDFFSVTRPLPYASPASLDYVARLNFPHPFMGSGFSDLGVKGSWRAVASDGPWIPSEVTFYVTNGMQENPLQGRSFPRSEVLGEPSQQKGVQIDYGHEVTTLADNNDAKQWGARLRYALGDLRMPLLPEGTELKGAQLGFSAMSSKYDVEDLLDYRNIGCDFVFQAGRYSIATELIYGYNDYRIAKSTAQAATKPMSQHLEKHREHQWGYYVSNSFHLPNFFYGNEAYAFLGLSSMVRRGNELIFDSAQNAAFEPEGAPKIVKWIYKYTLGVRTRIRSNFDLKAEYSYWNLAKGYEAFDIYQWAIAGLVRF